MRSQLAERLGALEPQIVHLPPDVASLDAAEEAIELADAYGLCDGYPLDESQKFTLRAGLGERADGSWAAPTVGDFEPRQNGKNDTCAARELAGLLLFGERLQIHTAHEFPTANESFLRLVAVFEAWDDLRKRVARIRYANGEQGIELLTGQRLKYKARTGGSGRGFAQADLVVYDEAQHLQAEHVAASGPARLANPNSQSWYMGSGGLATSHNAWRMRRRALTGDGGRLAYVEHTAEQVSLDGRGKVVSARPDVMDRDAWALANPAYGRRTTDEGYLSLFEELGPALFGRECLCLWDAEEGEEGGSVISLDVWNGDPLLDSSTGWEPVGLPVFAVDVAPDRSSSSIGLACWRPDGHPQVEVVAHGPGTAWVVPWLVERRAKYGRKMRRVADPGGPAGSLMADAEAQRVPLEPVSAREHAQACGLFYDDAIGGVLRHRDEPLLTAALDGACKRPMGDAWLWDRKSLVDISPLVAVTLARWALPPFDKPKARVVSLADALAAHDAEEANR